jgi:photosystem II stability/assembly factor-like uncharacterized protein
MKTAFLILLVILGGCAQAQWSWQNPLPQGNNLVAVEFFSADTGYALASPVPFMKTTDGGVTWDVACEDDFNPDRYTLTNMDFVGKDIGYTAGYHSIMKTSDGGKTWISVTGDYIPVLFNDIQFFDPLNGYLGGRSIAGGGEALIYGTADGGSNWTIYPCPGSDVNGLSFLNHDTGWICGYAGVYKTMDGCNTWQLQLSGNSFFEVFFYDQDYGWARGGYNNEFYRTVDGGESWSLSYIGEDFDYDEIFFIDQNTGWMVGYEDDNRRVRKSNDGGQTWYGCFYDGSTTLTDLSVVNENVIWTVGSGGTIFKTSNGGWDWDSLQSGPRNRINQVFFHGSGADTGWAAGAGGLLMKTISGGDDWDIIQTGTTYELKDIMFVDAYTGYIGGYSNTFLKTADGGATWEFLPVSPGISINALSFIDADTGWVATKEGKVFRTDNGGAGWLEQSLGRSCSLNDIWFTDGMNGTAVGKDDALGLYFTSIDGGLSWVHHYTGDVLHRIKFLNDSKGWICGDDWYDDPGYLLATNDGGLSWEAKSNYGFTGYDLCFINQDTGWVVGEGGGIASTVNGGLSWSYPVEFTRRNLNSCYATSAGDLYLAGDNGTIVRSCTDTSTTFIPADRYVQSPPLLVVPNPVKDCALIKYKITEASMVTIDIFDGYGRTVEHITEKFLFPGEYHYRWCRKGCSNGLYIVSIKSGKDIFTGKIIII